MWWPNAAEWQLQFFGGKKSFGSRRSERRRSFAWDSVGNNPKTCRCSLPSWPKHLGYYQDLQKHHFLGIWSKSAWDIQDPLLSPWCTSSKRCHERNWSVSTWSFPPCVVDQQSVQQSWHWWRHGERWDNQILCLLLLQLGPWKHKSWASPRVEVVEFIRLILFDHTSFTTIPFIFANAFSLNNSAWLLGFQTIQVGLVFLVIHGVPSVGGVWTYRLANWNVMIDLEDAEGIIILTSPPKQTCNWRTSITLSLQYINATKIQSSLTVHLAKLPFQILRYSPIWCFFWCKKKQLSTSRNTGHVLGICLHFAGINGEALHSIHTLQSYDWWGVALSTSDSLQEATNGSW